MTPKLSVDLEISGLRLDRPMKIGAVWSSPLVAIEKDFLIYEAARVKHNRSHGLLRKLLDAASSRERTIKFCQTWGVLGLCEHGLPQGHANCLRVFRRRTFPGGSIAQFKEAIVSVQRFASGLESLLRIGAEMAQGRSGLATDWSNADNVIVGQDFPTWEENPSNLDLQTAREHLQILVRRLIKICGIAPRFFWNQQTASWQIDLDSEGSTNNLPALMVLELLVMIADKDGFAICSSCHRSYIPERRPTTSKRNYCLTCRGAATGRDASRAYRERKRSEKEKMHGKA